jgi:hypothetical protein
MNPAGKILAGIDAVKLTVRSVIFDWDASDISCIDASAAKLERSIQPLRAALNNPGIAGHLSAAELESAAQSLKKEAATLERLVDAAAAFVRSGPDFLSDNSAYTFAGEMGPVAARPTESYAG